MWSVDNDASAMVQKEREKATRRRRRGRRVRTVKRRSKGDRVMISQAMLMEVERVLQTQVLFGSFIYFWMVGKCEGMNDTYVLSFGFSCFVTGEN